MRCDSLLEGDSVRMMRTLPSDTFHLILSDIPYGIGVDDWDVLHNNSNSAYLGSSPAQARAGEIFKKRGKPLNGWSEADRKIPAQYHEWCSTWAPEWLRVLKPGGSAMVFAGRRLAHRCVSALEDAGFTYKDMIAWVRDQAAHRAQRLSVVFDRRGDLASKQEWEGWKVGNLRPTFEPVLWFVKPYPIGTTIADNVLAHGIGAYNEQAIFRYQGSANNVLSCGMERGEGGLHPTQKPLRLMKTLIELTTREGQLVLDPFCGSGTTLLAAKQIGRHYVGIEQNDRFCETARERLSQACLFDGVER